MSNIDDLEVFKDITVHTDLPLHIEETVDYKNAIERAYTVALIDNTGVIKSANSNYCKLSQYSQEELSDKPRNFFNPAFHSVSFMEGLWRAVATDLIWKGELQNMSKDGTKYWVDTTISPFTYENKIPIQYIVIQANITEKKEIEQSFLTLNVKLNLKVKNRTAGLEKANKDLQSFSYLVSEDLREPLRAVTGYAKELEETYRDTLDSEGIRMLAEIQNNAKKMGVLTVKLEKANHDLERANKELEAFSYSVSHDLRSPLRAVSGYAQLMAEDYGSILDSEGIRLLSEIQLNAKGMGKLIDDLLAFSKIGRSEIQRAFTNMTEVTHSALAEVLGNSPYKEPVVTIEALDPIMAESSLLRQVMVNLISNAVKFSSKATSPAIVISSNKKDGQVIYNVSDNGVGFDNKYSERVFGVFKRLHSVEEFEGTGIGLALAHRIVEKHGGKIWAEAALNSGAVFHFSLPGFLIKK